MTTKGLPGWLRLPLVMAGWALLAAVAANSGLVLAIVVGVLLAALWLWRLQATAAPDQTWGDTTLFAIAWSMWGLAAWLGILFVCYIGYFVGAYLELWELEDR